jgi:hypothetical protein
MVRVKKKLPKKISKLIKDKYYGDKPIVQTKDKNVVEPSFLKEVEVGILVAKIRANKKYYRDKYGEKQFDAWYKEIQENPIVLKNQTKYLEYLKKLRKDTQFNHDNGTLTPKEYSELKGEKQNKYIALIVDDPTLFAFYITIGSSNDAWWNKRPTKENLKQWSKEREEEIKSRDKTWWSPLTDAQKHFILTNTKEGMTWSYMDKPLSTPNIWAMKDYISRNSGIASLLPKKNIQVIDNIKPIEILQRQREQLGEQVKKLLGREQQVLNTMRVSFPAFRSIKENKIPLNVKTANTVAREHGLNEYKTRNKINSNVDIAETYLKQFKSKKIDYYVNSYQNAVALAESVGMIPQDLFITLCHQIVKRKTHYKKEEFLNTGNAVAELVELYQAKQKRLSREDTKLSTRAFFRSLERKAWSKKYNWDWKNHARFNEEFPKWVKIQTSVATPKKPK